MTGRFRVLRIPRKGQLTPGDVGGNFSRQMILELDLVKKFTLIEEIWVKRTLSL